MLQRPEFELRSGIQTLVEHKTFLSFSSKSLTLNHLCSILILWQFPLVASKGAFALQPLLPVTNRSSAPVQGLQTAAVVWLGDSLLR